MGPHDALMRLIGDYTYLGRECWVASIDGLSRPKILVAQT